MSCKLLLASLLAAMMATTVTLPFVHHLVAGELRDP
jgi:hypothetical protein